MRCRRQKKPLSESDCMSTIDLLSKIVIAYLLGSIMGSLLLGRWRGVDIRSSGSGNAGGTNALRALGWRFAIAVVFIDVGKATLATWLGMQILIGDSFSPLAQGLWCGVFCMLGHAYPIFYRFRGGKAAACLLGVLVVAQPILLLPFLICFVLTLLLTGYVSLATIIAAVGLPFSSYFVLQSPERELMTTFSVIALLLIIFFHRSNVLRLWRHEEYRFEKIWLFAKPQSPTPQSPTPSAEHQRDNLSK